jgi:hypothetical protein
LIKASYFKENYLEIVLALLYLNAALPHTEEFYVYFKIIMYLITIALLIKRWLVISRVYIGFIFIFLLIDNPIYVINLRDFIWVIYDVLVMLFYIFISRTYQKY